MANLIDILANLPRRLAALPTNFKYFLLTVILYVIAIEGIYMVVLNLYLLRLGYGTEFIGTLNSAGLLIFALVSLPLGAVQRYSGRRMLQFGQFISFIGLIGLVFATYTGALQDLLLIFFRICTMIGLSAYFVHQLPYAMEITTQKWHDRVLAWTMAIFSMAAFVGSWLGGYLPVFFGRILSLTLDDVFPYQAALLTAAVIALIAMFSMYLVRDLPEADSEGGEQDESISAEITLQTTHLKPIIGLVITILIIRGLQTFGVGVLQTYYNVYFDEILNMASDRIGLVSGLGRFIGVPLSLTIPFLVNRFGNFRLVIISLSLIISLLIPLALVPTWGVASITLITINSMGSIRYLSFLAFTMALVTKRQRRLISGAGEMAIGTGFAISSFLGGYIIAWYGYRELFLFGAGVTAIGTFTFWLVFRKRSPLQTANPRTVTH